MMWVPSVVAVGTVNVKLNDPSAAALLVPRLVVLSRTKAMLVAGVKPDPVRVTWAPGAAEAVPAGVAVVVVDPATVELVVVAPATVVVVVAAEVVVVVAATVEVVVAGTVVVDVVVGEVAANAMSTKTFGCVKSVMSSPI